MARPDIKSSCCAATDRRRSRLAAGCCSSTPGISRVRYAVAVLFRERRASARRRAARGRSPRVGAARLLDGRSAGGAHLRRRASRARSRSRARPLVPVAPAVAHRGHHDWRSLAVALTLRHHPAEPAARLPARALSLALVGGFGWTAASRARAGQRRAFRS